MHEKILEKMRECIWSGNFIVPTHALVAIAQDRLTREDAEHCILNGEIVERQRDRLSGEFKYIIYGPSEDGHEIEVVAKITLVGDTYVITVYRVY
jgi:hypothetical protein